MSLAYFLYRIREKMQARHTHTHTHTHTHAHHQSHHVHSNSHGGSHGTLHGNLHNHSSGLNTKKLSEFAKTINFWRHLTNFWTVVFFAFIIADFVLNNYFDERGIILTIAAVYGAALAVYSTEKEFKRWSDEHTNVHPGEIYIALWTVLIFTLIILGIFMDKHYRMPPEVSSSYIVVIGILAITKESKKQYKKKRLK